MTELSDKLEKAEQVQAGKLAPGGETIFEQLRKMEGQFAAALPAHISAEHFVRVALTELRLKPELQACTPQSLMGALVLSAQLGLVPGPLGHVYLVPYGNTKTRGKEVQFQIGYKGFVVLADRAGYSITGDAIREGDYFDFEVGSEARVTHKPKVRGAGDVYAWWVMASPHAPGRPPHIKVLDRDAVESYRKRSRATGAGSPWATDYDAMALKTTVRRVMALLPLDAEQAQAADYSADYSRAMWQPGTHELTVSRSEDFDALDGGADVPEPEEAPE